MAKKFTQKETEQLIAGIREAYETKLRQLQYRLEGLEGGEQEPAREPCRDEGARRAGQPRHRACGGQGRGDQGVLPPLRRNGVAHAQTVLRQVARPGGEHGGGHPRGGAKKVRGVCGRPCRAHRQEKSAVRPAAEEETFDPKAVIEKYVEGKRNRASTSTMCSTRRASWTLKSCAVTSG